MRVKLKSITFGKRLLCLFVISLGLFLTIEWTARAQNTFTVTKTADTNDGVCDADCSLREAITAANNNPGLDTIAFNIGSGLQTIQPSSQLPTITDPVLLDGTTQPGFAGAPLIEIDGSQTTNSKGLAVNSNGPSTIRGLIINRFAFSGIELKGTGSNVVAGNYVGTNAAGNANFPNPNNGVGISVLSSNNTIGGLTAADRNIISGNRSQSVSMGIDVFGAGAIGNKIIGNYIGTDVGGTLNLGQLNAGIRLANASGTMVGGSTAAERNVISANLANIDVLGHDNKIMGNYLGTKPDGTGGQTSPYGVFIENNAQNNIIGGTNAGEGNLIPATVNRGVTVTDTSMGNSILGNSILSPIPIDLKFDGVTLNDYGATLNDPSDADTGPNNLQNYPVINTVTPNGSNTIIDGILRTEANKMYRIELFSNAGCNQSGFGAGTFFVAATNVATNSSGNANFNFTIPTASITGSIFTATATDPANNTSEFSQCMAAGPSANGAFQFGAALLNVSEDAGTANIAVTRTNGSAGAVSVNYATSGGTATPGSDYTAKSGKLDFADGETSKTITIDLTNDSVSEPTEDFNVTLSNPTGGASLGAQKVIDVIIGDDDAPTISINNVQVTEGNSGTTANATFTVSLTRAYFKTVTVDFATDTTGTATSGTDYLPTAGTITFNVGETSKPATVLVNGDDTQEPNETFFVKLTNNTGVGISGFTGVGTIIDDDAPAPTIQFSQASYSVQEDQTSVAITVTRSGDLSSANEVDYATSDQTAGQRSDYTIALGTLSFAPGETSKSLQVLINEDAYAEGNEQFEIKLSNPSGGAVLGTSTTTVTIIDDSPETVTNPIDSAQSFVHMHYHDFLNREPDAAGLAFWTSQITSCLNNGPCIEAKRNSVSASFFLSIEFQETAYLIYLMQRESFVSSPKYASFMRDWQEVSHGVIVNTPGWQQLLHDNQKQFAAKWIRRAGFKAIFDPLSNNSFVNTLFANAGVMPEQAERDALIAGLNSASLTRADVVLSVASNSAFRQQQQSSAFVLMQYFGYLRRNPDAAPDVDMSGYNFWLNKLNQFGGNYEQAEMVKAFLTSFEYRQRFGQ